MKRHIIGIFFMSVLFACVGAFAQHTPVIVGDTLIVPPYRAVEDLEEGETEADTLYNSMIYYAANDTNPDGSQAHKYYKLLRGYYYMIQTYGNEFHSDVVIFADPPTEELGPPILNGCIDPDWEYAGPTLEVFADAEIRNIYFNGLDNTERGPQWGGAINTYGTGSTVIVENCWFEYYGSGLVMSMFAEDGNLYVNNCRGRNLTNAWDNRWCAQFVAVEAAAANKVHITNCTLMNAGGFILSVATGIGGTAKEVIVDHNTWYCNTEMPLSTVDWTNARISNNLFVDLYSYAPTQLEVDLSPDKMPPSIVNIDTLGAGFDTLYGEAILEKDRTVIVENNAWFNDQILKDFWAEGDSLIAPVWMNARTQAMFDDDENYPGLVTQNNYMDEEPVFANCKGVESLVQWTSELRRNGTAPWFWGWDDEIDRVDYGPDFPYLWYVLWPRLEDLSYTNSTLATGSTEGWHVGDLNWYPDELAQYEKPGVTAVEDRLVTGPTEFTLEQNYPNPFNPTTTIAYTLNKAGDVKLTVYDILGAKVSTLVNKSQTAGLHTVQWNATNERGDKLSSGIYFYKLEMEGRSLMKKMMLLK
jgi:hypothetical protein